MESIAINVDNVSKIYRLYNKPSDRLKEALGFSKKKLYQEHYALNNVSFEVRKGETVGIIGTNGSGKSTILKIITGVLNPTQGNVSIQGRISALLELGAGFNMEYTGIENIYLNGTMMGFSEEEINAKMDDILSFADIGDFVHQPVKTYSSGMFARLAFAGKPKEIVDLYKQLMAQNDAPTDVPKTVVENNQQGMWKQYLNNNPKFQDYGEKHGEIVDYAIIDETGKITSNIQKNTEFTIKMKVRFHKELQEPIFAFTIKDLQGTEVTGTNTMYEDIPVGPVKAGEERVIEFKQNMNLQGRDYMLSLGCVGFFSNKFVVYHRLYDVCDIHVISDKNTVGFYDMNSTVTITK